MNTNHCANASSSECGMSRNTKTEIDALMNTFTKQLKTAVIVTSCASALLLFAPFVQHFVSAYSRYSSYRYLAESSAVYSVENRRKLAKPSLIFSSAWATETEPLKI